MVEEERMHKEQVTFLVHKEHVTLIEIIEIYMQEYKWKQLNEWKWNTNWIEITRKWNKKNEKGDDCYSKIPYYSMCAGMLELEIQNECLIIPHTND